MAKATRPAGKKPAPKKTTRAATGKSKRTKPVRRRRDSRKSLRRKSFGLPEGDYTLKTSEAVPNLALVRPTFDKGSLIFRPLPAWNPDDETKFDSYRMSQTEDHYSDFMRKYPAVYFLGEGDDCVTFNLYDGDWGEDQYDRKDNPYIILFNAIKKAAVRDNTRPEWRYLIESSRPVLSKPCDLYYFQGVIFKRGADVYIAGGKPPRGFGGKDYPQIVQLKNTAGSSLMTALNAVKSEEDYDGDPKKWEQSMVAGDPVHPKFGRFFTVYNPKLEQLGGENVDDIEDYEVGGDGAVDAGSGEDDIKGYRSLITDRLFLNGRRTKINAHLDADKLAMAKKRVVWFDDIINGIPMEVTDDSIAAMHHQQCLWIARALRGYRAVLEFGWDSNPEFLEDKEVQKILKNAKQVAIKGQVDDESLYDDDETATTAAMPDGDDDIPDADEDTEYEDAEVEDVDEDEEPEADVEGDDDEYEDEEPEDADEEPEGDDDEYEEEPEDADEEPEDDEPEDDEPEDADEEPEGDDDDEYEYVEVEVDDDGNEVDDDEPEGDDDEPEDSDEYEDDDDEPEDAEEDPEGEADDDEYDEEEEPEADSDLEEDEEAARKATAAAKKRSSKRKTTADKKAPAKKAPAKKAPAKKAAADKKAPAKKAPAKKKVVKKSAPPEKKGTTKKAPPKKKTTARRKKKSS